MSFFQLLTRLKIAKEIIILPFQKKTFPWSTQKDDAALQEVQVLRTLHYNFFVLGEQSQLIPYTANDLFAENVFMTINLLS